jgi:hypothetical protein
MKKKLYIETSVWNQLSQDERPDFRIIAEKFLHTVETGLYDIYVSDYLFFELELKIKRMDGFNGVNILNGYGEIRLITPEFFIPEEADEKNNRSL